MFSLANPLARCEGKRTQQCGMGKNKYGGPERNRHFFLLQPFA